MKTKKMLPKDLVVHHRTPLDYCEFCHLDISKVVSCTVTELKINGLAYDRIVRENSEGYDSYGECHDCGIIYGGIHHLGCDMEKCPSCKLQLISCPCDHNYHIWDSENFQKSAPEIPWNSISDNTEKRILLNKMVAKRRGVPPAVCEMCYKEGTIQEGEIHHHTIKGE
jgi:hypothetical protein